jgi:hypothetical protein
LVTVVAIEAEAERAQSKLLEEKKRWSLNVYDQSRYECFAYIQLSITHNTPHRNNELLMFMEQNMQARVGVALTTREVLTHVQAEISSLKAQVRGRAVVFWAN